jgi:hypothetical protein
MASEENEFIKAYNYSPQGKSQFRLSRTKEYQLQYYQCQQDERTRKSFPHKKVRLSSSRKSLVEELT